MECKPKIHFCRLCLNTVFDQHMKEIGNYEINTLTSLLIDLNLNTTGRYVMCEHCFNKIGILYKFKTMCLTTQNSIASREKNDTVTQIDLMEVHKKEKDCDDLIHSLNGQMLCPLCLKVTSIEIRSLGIKDSDENSVQYMINRCIPELDMGVIKEQIICKNCYNCLTDYISFMSKCIEIENRIDYFCHINGIDKNDDLNLSDVVEFNSKDDILRSTNTWIKREEDHEILTGNNEIYIKPENVEIKLENYSDGPNDYDDDDPETRQLGLHFVLLPGEPKNNEFESLDTANSDFSKTETYSCDSCSYKTKSKKIFIKHAESHRRFFTCDTCNFQTHKKTNLIKHFNRQQNPDGEQTFKCHVCFFTSKYKNCLPHHKKTHDVLAVVEKKFKCDMCNFKTPNKRYLKRHLIAHKDHSETEIYKCDLCPYTTKQKLFLRSHVSKHGAPKYECQFCTYKAKYSSCFRRHMSRWHKNESEKQKYICYFCAYETSDREGIVRHLRTHSDPSKAPTYKCELCNFETQVKVVFKRHLAAHKDPQALEDAEEPYKCDKCEYKTKLESNLKGHMLVHKPEPGMFHCTMCSYSSPKRSCLRRHVARHKPLSERIALKCAICDYETYYKPNLMHHLLGHRDAADVEIYKCQDCSYETRYKEYLKMHMRRHIGLSVKKVYSCEICSYETYLPMYLRRHMKVHKKIEESESYELKAETEDRVTLHELNKDGS